MNWLDDLGVDESFLADAASQIPEASEINRRHVYFIQNSQFTEASDQYKARITQERSLEDGGEMNLIVFEGSNASNGKESQNPPSYSVGGGFQRDNDDGGETAVKLKSDKDYKVIHGSTKYGKLIRDLSVKFGITAGNADAFKQVDKVTNKEFLMGPDYIRFTRWYLARHEKKAPNFMDSTVWNGVYLQMDAEYWTSNRDGNFKEGVQGVPIGIAKLEGETEAEYAFYLKMLEATGTPKPWYVLGPNEDPLHFDYEENGRVLPPMATLENKGKFENTVSTKTPPAKTNGTTKTAAAPPKTETKTEAAPAKTETKAAAPAATGGAALEEMHNKLMELVATAADFKAFKPKAMMMVKPIPHLIPWVVLEENYKALAAGDVAELPTE